MKRGRRSAGELCRALQILVQISGFNYECAEKPLGILMQERNVPDLCLSKDTLAIGQQVDKQKH